MSTSREAGRPSRLLIVDDERDNRELLEIILTRAGYEIATAASGAEALAIVAKRPPDLVLLDVMMPEMDGYEVAARLKSSGVAIFVIMVSAHDDRSARLRAQNVGADDFVAKPVDRAELCARIKNLLCDNRAVTS